jgi:hypothetical protein
MRLSRTRRPEPPPRGGSAAWTDVKLANVLYQTGRPRPTTRSGRSPTTSGASTTRRDRFTAVAGRDGWPYADALELGSGTGFFLLNLMQAGVATRGHVTDLSPGMVEARGPQRRRPRARRRRPGRGRRVDPVRRRVVRPGGRSRRPAPHPRRRARAARGAAGPEAGRPVRLRRGADDRGRLVRTPTRPAHLAGDDDAHPPGAAARALVATRGGARRVVARGSAGVGGGHPHLRPAGTRRHGACAPALSTCAPRPRS